MSRLTLDSCWAKIERARDHTDRLEKLEKRFLKRRPNRVFFDKEAEPPWVLIMAVVEPVPLLFSTVAGDLVQNLRSCLDHLVWQLVLLDGGTPGRHTSFPICSSKPHFDERTRNPSKDRPGPLEGIEVDGQKWTLIERLQPYHGPVDNLDITPLPVLSKLSNTDKHQTLLAGVSFVHAFDPWNMMEVVGLEASDFEVTFEGGDVLTHNTEIARFRPVSTGSMEMTGDFPFDITFSDRDPADPEALAVPVAGFDLLRSEVVRAVRTFEPFFDAPAQG
jgi:hypothetical protein